MTALQYVYTSWKNGTLPEKGYMIYSKSVGITDEECVAIKDAMQYIAPKELPFAPTPEEITDVFPYSFAYFFLPTGRACVAQSTYIGKDYSGRYGNYVIHALVLEKEALECDPTELFGEMSIKTAMTEEELNATPPVPPLPPLDLSEYGSVINDDQLNEFVFDKEESLAKLISLYIESKTRGVPFYLNDTRENLVLWAAALRRVLPPRFSEDLTFNTYVFDHERLLSARIREEGLHFDLLGVRPDANFFDYATEKRSGRHVVLDLVGGHETEGVAVSEYAVAMAASLAMDLEEIEAFAAFVEGSSITSVTELADAYRYFALSREDGAPIDTATLPAILSFGARYASAESNAAVAASLLSRLHEAGALSSLSCVKPLWEFVGAYCDYMKFTLYELTVATMIPAARSAPGELSALLDTLRAESSARYLELKDYINSAAGIGPFLSEAETLTQRDTLLFYLDFLSRSYSAQQLSADESEPVAGLYALLLGKLMADGGDARTAVRLLLSAASSEALYAHTMRTVMRALTDGGRLAAFAADYTSAVCALGDDEQGRLEERLIGCADAAPLAAEYFVRRIPLTRDPLDALIRFFDRYGDADGLPAEPAVRACLDAIPDEKRGDAVLAILARKLTDRITDEALLRRLAQAVAGLPLKALMDVDTSALEALCAIGERVSLGGLAAVRAVLVAKRVALTARQERCVVALCAAMPYRDAATASFEKADYELYLKSYLDSFLALLSEADDLPALFSLFYHPTRFESFLDGYISALKKMKKSEESRLFRLLTHTAVYLINTPPNDTVADAAYKPLLRFIGSQEDAIWNKVRAEVEKSTPHSASDRFFEESRKKEGLAAKLGKLFGKK